MRPGATDTVRIDKWLWAARFFKTRSLAQQAVEGGRVKLNGERVKPARALKVGDRLDVQIGDYEWILTVRGLADRRGPAAIAQQLYAEDEESRLKRKTLAAERRLRLYPSATMQGRPTKRHRRLIDGELIGAGVDLEQQLPLVDEFLVPHVHLDDLAGDVTGDVDDVRTHLPVPRPGAIDIARVDDPGQHEPDHDDRSGYQHSNGFPGNWHVGLVVAHKSACVME